MPPFGRNFHYLEVIKIVWKSFSHVQFFGPHGLHSPWNSLGQNTQSHVASYLGKILISFSITSKSLISEKICIHHYIIPTYHSSVGVTVKVTQLCLTLCDPTDYSVHGILQARILEYYSITEGDTEVSLSPWDLPNSGIKPRSPAL